MEVVENNKKMKTKMIQLISSEFLNSKDKNNVAVKVTKEVACMSKLIEEMLVDEDDDDEEEDDDEQLIPLPNITNELLKEVVKYCEYHLDNPMKEIARPLNTNDLSSLVDKWDVQFMDRPYQSIFDLMIAANYLLVTPLVTLCGIKLATFIRGNSEEEIRKAWDIPELTPEEEAKLKEEHKWIFQPYEPLVEVSQEEKEKNAKNIYGENSVFNEKVAVADAAKAVEKAAAKAKTPEEEDI